MQFELLPRRVSILRRSLLHSNCYDVEDLPFGLFDGSRRLALERIELFAFHSSTTTLARSAARSRYISFIAGLIDCPL